MNVQTFHCGNINVMIMGAAQVPLKVLRYKIYALYSVFKILKL